MNGLSNLTVERQSLADYIRRSSLAHGNGFVENLAYVEKFLHKDITLFRRMLDHAESLKNYRCTNHQLDIDGIVKDMTEQEIPVVKDYVSSLDAYVRGKPFNIVYEAAAKLSYLKPIPDTIYAPPGTFSKELAEAYEQV